MSLARKLQPEPAFDVDEIRAARTEARRQARPLIDVLEERAEVPRRVFVARLAATFGYAAIGPEMLSTLSPDFAAVTYSEAAARGCLPLRDEDGRLLLAIGDPFAADLEPWAEERFGEACAWSLAHPAEIAAALARHEESLAAMDGAVFAAEARGGASSGAEELSLKTISADASPVVRLVHSTIYDALRAGASDVHLETGPEGLAIKYRIDGVLSPVGTVGGLALAEQVLSRVKVMAELDIAERRIPQDGRFKVTISGREVDFRVSIMPSLFGEDAVLRILDKRALSDRMRGLRLDSLGFDDDTVALLRRLAGEPYGMVLVTGPTGSGKTTTLYGAISEINDGRDKIVTIEDPVEYQLPGVLQIPVNEKKGLTFARGLRSILRHDPDKIMVGEIRDPETAQIAVQSALTGHLVFTTVHANSVFDVIGRFMHMGVDPYSFVSALNGIVAQRLLRINCADCAASDRPDAALLAASGLADGVGGFTFRAGSGCGRCRGTGYRGRRAIAETLRLNDEIRELIVARAPNRHVREAALRGGTRFLREAALDLVRRGETTLQEINRVTFAA